LTFTCLLAAWAGCSGGGSTGAGGAMATSSSHVTVGVGGAGGHGSCFVVDGKCDLHTGEDCNCVDCQDTAMCVPDQCTSPTSCDHLYDSCTCAGCAEDGFCGDPGKGNCKDDGVCQYFEGCHCADCAQSPNCAPRLAACAGGKPDGVCDRSAEDCSCLDCEGTPLCVPCAIDHVCSTNDPCSCSDCVGQSLCNDPTKCVDDGVCAIISEGCICNDCKALPECVALLDGGAPDASMPDASMPDASMPDAGDDASAPDGGDGGP
jgi:hypothetical protein